MLALVRAADEAVWGDSDWTEQELAEEWASTDLERDARVVELDGCVAGYATATLRGAGRVVGDDAPVRARRHAGAVAGRPLPEGPAGMSVLRARCPACRAFAAVALDDAYECHACGRTYAAGLVRVPRAWGAGGEAMADAAALDLPYPEAAVIARDTLEEQTATLAASLPVRPLVLGGCCCAHTGAIRGLAARPGRLAVVWLDAHGDLNTPESSPSGNAWGMPLRAALDEGAVAAADVALVGARSLDPPEVVFLREQGIDDDVERALTGCDRVYVALDCDVLDPAAIACFMPEPGGPGLDEVESVVCSAAGALPLAGLGLTGLRPEADAGVLARLAAAAGL